jgi:exonuclease SbcC
MKIQFSHIEIEGFRSIVKPFQFFFNTPGITLLKGVNGAGKTSFIEALVWALYGINLKDTKIDQVATWVDKRTASFQGTRVGVTFSVGGVTYCVTRHLNYKGLTYDVKGENYLILAKEGVMIGDFRNKDLTQQEINRLLGIDSKVFMNSVMFGQRMSKLVEQDNGDKRELFETLFETVWIDILKSRNAAKLAEAIGLISDVNNKIINTQQMISTYETTLLSNKALLDQFETGRKARQVEQEEYLKTYIDALSLLEPLISEQEKQLITLGYDNDKHDGAEKLIDIIAEEINAAKLKQQQEQSRIQLAEQTRLNEIRLKQQQELNRVQQAEQSRLNAIEAASTAVANADQDVERVSLIYKTLKDKHIEGNCPYCAQELLPGNKLEVNHSKDLEKALKDVTDAKKKAADLFIAFRAAEAVEKTFLQVVIEKPVEQVKAADLYNTVDLTDLQTQLAAAKEVLAKFDDLWNTYEKITDQIAFKKTQQDQCNKDITRTQQAIEKIKNEKPPVIDSTAIELKLSVAKSQLQELSSELPGLNITIANATWWNTKGFSSSGLKAFIFKAMLSQLNENVRKYGDRLGASLEFSIDLTKASKPFTTVCSLGNILNKEYKEFSGGQKQRLDIVLIFAMFDLISMNTDINIMVMDEVFEGLDEGGEAAVFDLIRLKADEGKQVYVITHSATLDSLYCSSIEFAEVNGSTQIIN